MTVRKRPASVTILAGLQGLLGTLCLLGVFALTVAGFRFTEVVPHVRLFPVKLFVVVIVLFVLACIEFVMTYGLWNGLGMDSLSRIGGGWDRVLRFLTILETWLWRDRVVDHRLASALLSDAASSTNVHQTRRNGTTMFS